MKHLILLGGALAMLSCSPLAQAGDIGYFTVVGEAADGSDIEAQWEGETMAEAVAENSSFTLQIPEGDVLPYHPGDKLELVIDGKPTDNVVKLGEPGTSMHLSLHKDHSAASTHN